MLNGNGNLDLEGTNSPYIPFESSFPAWLQARLPSEASLNEQNSISASQVAYLIRHAGYPTAGNTSPREESGKEREYRI